MTDPDSPTQSRRFVFAGGGSGGHLTPSLAIAAALLQRDADARLMFLTSGRDIDRRVLSRSAITDDPRCDVVALPITQPPGIRWPGPLHVPALGRSVLKCHQILKQNSADVVLATGAFASVPGLLAAKRLKIPTVLFEANAVPGKVNRWWARHAALRFSGWPVNEKPADSSSAAPTFEAMGMPVRTDFGADVAPVGERGRQILIVGGSQGSRRLNEVARDAIQSLQLPDGWNVLHQTGAGDGSDRLYDSAAQGVREVSFIDDLSAEMRRSNLVISRAGAVTLGELAAAGCPAVLLPMQAAADNHQHQNAKWLEDRGAAMLVQESDSRAADQVVAVVRRLLDEPMVGQEMSRAMQSLHQPGAAERIAQRLLELTETRSGSG